MLDLDACIEKLYKCEPISEHAVKWICEKVRELLVNEPNVLCLSSPLTVVGDVHGYYACRRPTWLLLLLLLPPPQSHLILNRQFYDVIELFRIAGYVPDTNYLFLGDFVDRYRRTPFALSPFFYRHWRPTRNGSLPSCRRRLGTCSGHHSVETVSLLLALKLRHPHRGAPTAHRREH